MGSRFPSHQLSNGLFVSGRPEQHKERQQTMSSTSMPYTGGDVKRSGELGKMFVTPAENSKLKKSGPISNVALTGMGSFVGASSYSGPLSNGAGRNSAFSISGPLSIANVSGLVPQVTGLSRQQSNPGSLNRQGDLVKKSSGSLPGGVAPIALPATGLITSTPISSRPLKLSGAPQKGSGPLDSSASTNLAAINFVQNQALTKLSHEDDHTFWMNFPKPIFWSVILLFMMGFIAGGFILGVVHNAVLLIVVIVLFAAVATLYIWNIYWGRRSVMGFLMGFPEADLRTVRDGQYVKISGVVTCGNVPLESSFQKVPRCIYSSTSLYDYRGLEVNTARAMHRHFSWGLVYLERHVADFYISDSRSGLRALVKAGYGARVIPYVDESIVVDVDQRNSKLSTGFLRWLGARKISVDNNILRMKEGYIREGSTVSVMGLVQRNENILMIVPPQETLSTGCQWGKCLLPATLDGIILACQETSNADVMPV